MLFLELQINMDAIRCSALDTEVPGHHQEQLAQTLFVSLLKMQFYVDPKIGMTQVPLNYPPWFETF